MRKRLIVDTMCWFNIKRISLMRKRLIVDTMCWFNKEHIKRYYGSS
jgi:hypothetical protein